MLKTSELPGSGESKTQLLERAVLQKCMGCHRRQASLGFTTPVHHDQHLPDQPGSTGGASAPQQGPLGPHPSSTSITRPQQISHPVFGWCSVAAFVSVGWRIHLSVLLWQNGKHFLLKYY